MEKKARRFREEAARYNRGRKGVRLRYPGNLRRQALSYCSERQRQGGSLKKIAEELGIHGWSLNRWIREAKKKAEFVKVEVQPPSKPNPAATGSCVLVTPEGYRVEGLTLNGVGHLLQVLR